MNNRYTKGDVVGQIIFIIGLVILAIAAISAAGNGLL